MGITETERQLREEIVTAREAQKVVLEAHAEARAAAEEGKRVDMTVEQLKAFDDADAVIQRASRELEAHLSYRRTEAAKDQYAEMRGESRDEREGTDELESQVFSAYLRGGPRAIDRLTDERQRQFAERSFRAGMEVRTGSPGQRELDLRAGAALSTVAGAGIDGDAGFLIPQGFWHNLQIALKEYGGIMPYFNEVRTSTGNPMPWPTTDPTGQLGKYISENTQLTGSDLIEFGQGMLYAWMLSSDVIKASLQIINDSAFNVDSFVRDRVAERIGRKIAAELWTGSGPASSALTGVSTALTAYNAAFTRLNTAGATPAQGGYYQPAAGETAFWLAKGTTATATLANAQISWQSILGMIGSVDPAYRKASRCRFFANDVVQQNLRGLTDAYARPLWVPDVTVGPDDGPVARIEGYPITIDQNAGTVSTSAATAGGLLFGDLKTAMVLRTVTQSGLLTLRERFADYLQVAWIGFQRYDSQPNDLRAVVQYYTGAS